MSRKTLSRIICSLKLDNLMRMSKCDQVTILSLHRISYENDYFFDPIKPDIFEKLLKHILKNYQVISFEELSENKKTYQKPPLILSFDDGYYDFYEYALPILAKYKLPSNHNIINECANSESVIWTQRLNAIFSHCRDNEIKLSFDSNGLGESITNSENNWIQFYLNIFQYLLKVEKKTRFEILQNKEKQLSIFAESKMMGWDEIRECSKFNVEIGSHTYSHDSIPTITDENTLIFEIAKSKNEIEERINKPVSIIALPNGQGNKRVNDIVRQSNYKYLLYVNDETNNLENISGEPPLILNRIGLVNESFYEMILRTELFQSKLRNFLIRR